MDSQDLRRATKAALTRAADLSARLDRPALMEELAQLPDDQIADIWAEFSTLDRARLQFHVPVWARGKQDPDPALIPPHRHLFFLGGRGSGKTFAALHRFCRRARTGGQTMVIVGPTLREIENYMIEGSEAAPGILRMFPPGERPEYRAHKARIDFKSGAICHVNTAENSEYRGSGVSTVWGDELVKWRKPETLWSNILFSARARTEMGVEIILSSTPSGSKFFQRIISDPQTVTILSRTIENRANVDQEDLIRALSGTRLGRQELEGEVLFDDEGSIFTGSDLAAHRVTRPEDVPKGLRIVVSVDPAIETNENNDPTGICVVGVDDRGHIYVLESMAGRWDAEEWGRHAIEAYDRHSAVAVVCETNRGGNLVLSNVRTAARIIGGQRKADTTSIHKVKAANGKAARAEPVGALTEKGLVHVVGFQSELEDELTSWSPAPGKESPNLLDAMVWGVYWLLGLDDGDRRIDPAENLRGFAEHMAVRLGGAVTPTEPQRPDLTRPLVRRPLGHRGRIA